MAFGEYDKKGRRFPVEVLTAEEVRSLIRATSRRGLCGVRDRALIAVLFRGGLRIAEALGLFCKDVDLVAGTVQILTGKGGKARVVGIDPEAAELVAKWIRKREGLGLNGRQPLFCTLAGGPMKAHQFREHLKALGEKAGIEKRVHPHGLRHSRACDLMRSGVAVPIIQRALGHTSLATTAVYLAHIAPQEVVDAMKGGAW